MDDLEHPVTILGNVPYDPGWPMVEPVVTQAAESDAPAPASAPLPPTPPPASTCIVVLE